MKSARVALLLAVASLAVVAISAGKLKDPYAQATQQSRTQTQGRANAYSLLTNFADASKKSAQVGSFATIGVSSKKGGRAQTSFQQSELAIAGRRLFGGSDATLGIVSGAVADPKHAAAVSGVKLNLAVGNQNSGARGSVKTIGFVDARKRKGVTAFANTVTTAQNWG